MGTDRQESRLTRAGGFTLIELIVTIAVGGFLVAGIVLLTRQQVMAGVQSRDHLTAVQLAKRRMAEVSNLPDASLATSTSSPYDSALPGFQCRTTVTNELTSGTVILRQILVEVDRASGSFEAPLASLRTYRVNVVTFGDGS